jgi:hypothetical protein
VADLAPETQYKITGLERSRKLSADIIDCKGKFIASGREPFENSRLDLTSTSCAPSANSLQASMPVNESNIV